MRICIGVSSTAELVLGFSQLNHLVQYMLSIKDYVASGCVTLASQWYVLCVPVCVWAHACVNFYCTSILLCYTVQTFVTY